MRGRSSRSGVVLLCLLTLAGCTNERQATPHSDPTRSVRQTPSSAVAAGLLRLSDLPPRFEQDAAARRTTPMATCLGDVTGIQRTPSFRGYDGVGQIEVEAALLNLDGPQVTAALTTTPQRDTCLTAAAVTAVKDDHFDPYGPAPQLHRNGTRWTVTMQTKAGDVISQATVALNVKTIKQGLVLLQVTATGTHVPEVSSRRLLEAAALRA